MLTRSIKVSTDSATKLLKLCRYADECDCPVHHEAITGGLRAVEDEASKHANEQFIQQLLSIRKAAREKDPESTYWLGYDAGVEAALMVVSDDY